MQKGSYNIEEVKEYFLYYVFGYSQKIEPQVYRYINKPTFVKESIICSTIGIVFIFGVIVSSILWVIYNFSFFTFIMLVVPTIVLGLMAKLLLGELKKSLLFGELLKFFHLKSSLIPFLEEFKKSVNKDIFTHGLKSLDIAHITQQMKNITSLVKIIAGPLIKFRNVGIYIPDKARNVLERFISIEVSWLSDYIRAFRETLSTWIEVHKAELSAYQKSELLSKDEEIYLLASSRLSSHIENIEKVKMQL